MLRDMWLLNERSYRRFDRALGAVCQDIEAKTKRPVLFHDSLVLGEYLPRIQARARAMEAVTRARAGIDAGHAEGAVWKFAEAYWHWLGSMMGANHRVHGPALRSLLTLAAAVGYKVDASCPLAVGGDILGGTLMPGLACPGASELVRQYPSRRCQELASYLEELACERAHVVQLLRIRKKDTLLHSRKSGLLERVKKLHAAHEVWASLASKYSGTNVRLTLAEVLSPGSSTGRDLVTDSGELTSFGVREVAWLVARPHECGL